MKARRTGSKRSVAASLWWRPAGELCSVWLLSCLLPWAAFAQSDGPGAWQISYWISPCNNPQETACKPGDVELARWAVQQWAKEGERKLRLQEVTVESQARVRLYWAGAREGLYGEMVPMQYKDPATGEMRQGAAVYVRPDPNLLGLDIRSAAAKDPLFRDVVVFLTCLHEFGHALGLRHTRDFDSIMYSFGYGGDILEYFQRYRRKLKSREEIQGLSGIRLPAASGN